MSLESSALGRHIPMRTNGNNTGEFRMWKAAFVGALALMCISLTITRDGIGVTQAAAQDVVVTDAHIAHLKAALKLSPSQEVHWRSLESVLRSVGQRAQKDENGLIQRVRARLRSYVLDA